MPVFVDDYFCILFSSLVEKNYNDEIWLTKAFKKKHYLFEQTIELKKNN